MLKKVTTLALILGVCTLLSAGDNSRSISEISEKFVGIEASSTNVQGDSFWGTNHEGNDYSIGIRLGAQNEKWRSMFVLDYFDSKDDDQNYERAMIQVDYYLMAGQFSTVAFRPYIGLNGGYLNYESTGIDESGFSYGGEIGFTADVADAVDLDISYRYSVASPDELDNIGNFVAGINYIY